MDLNIPKEKEDIIYEKALKEFAVNGYDKASTNTIVKEAGISKGALFKYFGSKANLYIYVVDRAIATLDKLILGNLENLPSDMFERIAYLTKVKVTVSMKYTLESSILVNSMSVEDEEIKKYINEKIAYYYGMLGKVFTEGIDYSRFKDYANPQKVYEILSYISEGLCNKFIKKFDGNFQAMLDDIDCMYEDTFSCINFIKDSVYKR